jgi:hypothetical protein
MKDIKEILVLLKAGEKVTLEIRRRRYFLH